MKQASSEIGAVKKEEQIHYPDIAAEDKINFERWLAIKNEITDIKNEQNPRRQMRLATDIFTKYGMEFVRLNDVLFSKYPQLKQEYVDIAVERLGKYMHADENALKESALEYFTKMHPTAKRENFNFTPKKGGDQVGKVLTINCADEENNQQSFTYYVKTHQHGSRSTSSAGATHVDLKELFVYKVLEHLGIGPKAHFFPNLLSGDQNGFYIATRDLSFSKSKTKAPKTFFIYEHYRNKNELDNISDVKFAALRIILGLTKIDILSRLFLLDDVGTNAYNFGFVIRDTMIKIKVIDFRIGTRQSYRREPDLLFQGFIEGNGTYDYHGFLGMVLRNRKEEEKIKEAQLTVEELKDSEKHGLLDAIDKAFMDIKSYAESTPQIWGKALDQKLADLEKYRNDIKSNFTHFESELDKRANKAQKTLSLNG